MKPILVRTIEVTDDYCSRVMETALDAGYTHGIGYWANVRRVKTRPRGETDPPYCHSRIVLLGLREDNDKWSIVRCDDVRRGILEALQAGHGDVLKTDDLDGPMADVIVQFACFGELVYG